jgi:hypothetical protein
VLVAVVSLTVGLVALDGPLASATSADHNLDCVTMDPDGAAVDGRDVRDVGVPDEGVTVSVTGCWFYYTAGAISPAADDGDSGSAMGGVTFTVTGGAWLNIYLPGKHGFVWTFVPVTAVTATASVAAKTYDGSTAATVDGCTLTGVAPGHDVSCAAGAATAAFDTAVPGTQPVTATGLTLTGADADLYTFDGTATGSGTIDAAPVTVAVEAADRAYDGTTQATVEGCSVAGVIGSDDVGCDFGTVDASFGSDAPGTWAVQATGITLTGADRNRYAVSGPVTGSASILKAPLSAAVTIAEKRFDGRRSAAITGCELHGVVDGDAVSCDTAHATATFIDDAPGDHAVTVTGIALGGADADRYSFGGSGSGTGTVAPPAAPAPTPRDDGRLPELAPGAADATEDGQPIELVHNADGEAVEVSGDGFSMRLTGEGSRAGDAGPVFTAANRVDASGHGFRPGTSVHVWVFSDPLYLGALTVAADGTFAGSFQLPADLVAGSHTIQASGMPLDGGVRVVNLGIEVAAPAPVSDAPSEEPTPVGLPRTGGTTTGLRMGMLALVLGAAFLIVAHLRRARPGALPEA